MKRRKKKNDFEQTTATSLNPFIHMRTNTTFFYSFFQTVRNIDIVWTSSVPTNIDVDSNSYKYPHKHRSNHHTFASCSMFTLVFHSGHIWTIWISGFNMKTKNCRTKRWRAGRKARERKKKKWNVFTSGVSFMGRSLICVHLFKLFEWFYIQIPLLFRCRNNLLLILLIFRPNPAFGTIIDVVRGHNNGKTFKWRKKTNIFLSFLLKLDRNYAFDELQWNATLSIHISGKNIINVNEVND